MTERASDQGLINLAEQCKCGATRPRASSRELVETMRRIARRVLRKHDYPPDKKVKATPTVLAQAEQIAKDWAG